MSGYGEPEDEGTDRNRNRDRHADLVAKQQQRRVKDTLARQPEPVTREDRRRAEVDRRNEELARAREARKLVDRIEDPALWGKAPRLTGEWKMNEKTGQHVRADAGTVAVPGPKLEWVAFGRHVETDPVTGWTGPGKYDIPQTGIPLHDGPELDEWTQATDYDYGGGPVAWEADIPVQDQGGDEVSL